MNVPDKLREMRIHPKHALGQNFLQDENHAEFIVKSLDIQPKDVILEVGPGLGVLTQRIVRTGVRMFAVEMDTGMFKQLQDTLGTQWKNLTLINSDILDVEIGHLEPRVTKIVSNLPFQISSPFTFQMLDYKGFEKAVITYQLEFAQRLVASPGSKDYSRLSVMAYVKAQTKLLRRIKAGAFFPPPKVESAVVEMIPRQSPPFKMTDEAYFAKVVESLFSQRRKTVKNSLRNCSKALCSDRDEFVKALSGLENKDRRPEELSPEEINEISEKLLKLR